MERLLPLSSKSNITEILTWLETGINLNSSLVFLHLMVSIKLNGEHHPYFIFKVFSIEIFIVLFTNSISQKKKKKGTSGPQEGPS